MATGAAWIMNLLDTALYHHEAGRKIISITEHKRPYTDGWNCYFTEPQSEAALRQQFVNGAHGLALILWPACNFVVLDFDGKHARDAWHQTAIDLPNTARVITRSGGEHLYFRMPSDPPELKRKVRLVKADCNCLDKDGAFKRCGVDLLIRGYAVLPPTPGYREDPDFPLESAVEIPAEILNLAQKQREGEAGRTGDADGKIRRGEQHNVAISLVGTMRRRGMSEHAMRAALKADSEQRFEPPLTDREIDYYINEAMKWAPGKTAEPEHLTDLGNARRLVRLFGDDLRFCNHRGWFTWSGKRWEQDETGAIDRLAKATVRLIYNEAASCEDKDLREKIASHAHKSESDARIKAMIELARTEPEIVVRHAQLDFDPWRLNVANGTLDLRTGELQPHRREDLITKIIPIDFYPEATCPTWLSFLDRVMAANQALIRFIQKCVGYSLTGSNREQIFFILYGVGANGKSTFIIVVSALLADYAMQTRTETLMAKRGDQIPNDIARLAGARFVSAIETEGGRRLAESLVKQMTGGDRMTARFLHREFFEFEPTFKLWLAVNHKPRIVGTDHAIWRRVRLIPFNVIIPDDERDPDLPEKLKAELPGILAWAVQGNAMWQLHGLKAPQTVTQATEQYREESDPLATFIDDRCAVEPEAEIGKTELYKAFRSWAEEAGERDLSQRNFNERVAERGFEDGRNMKNRFWKGLRLADL